MPGRRCASVLPGSHDTASAVAAVNTRTAFHDRTGATSVRHIGCWRRLDRPLITPECLARNFTNEGGVGGTTRLLKIFVDSGSYSNVERVGKDLEPTGIGIN